MHQAYCFVQYVPSAVKFRALHIRQGANFGKHVWDGVSLRNLFQNSTEKVPIRWGVVAGALEAGKAIPVDGADY